MPLILMIAAGVALGLFTYNHFNQALEWLGDRMIIVGFYLGTIIPWVGALAIFALLMWLVWSLICRFVPDRDQRP